MAAGFLKLLSNAKTRTLVILTGSILGAGVLIAIITAGKTGEPLENRTSKTSQVPSGVESTPGAKTSEKYKELQEKANTIGAEKAEKKGGTFVPTIVADKPKATEDLQSQFMKALEKVEAKKPAQDPRIAQMLAQQKQEEDSLAHQRKQQLAQANAEKMAALNEQRLKAIETVANAMEEQAKQAFNTWNDIPTQAFVEGDNKKNQDKAKEKEAANAANNAGVDSRKVILKSGSILFAVLETSVNSDEPGPIMARIIQPPFKDAKLIGKIELPQNNGEKIALHFETINIPSEPISNKISAVAIDPDTARTALASKVDNHYLSRWGGLFGSAFLEGYSKAVAKSGTTVTQQTGLGQTTTVSQTPNLSGKQQMFEGLGKVGEQIGNKMSESFNRKPTITIEPGTGIGILILADVKLGPEPVKPNTTQDAVPNQTKAANSMDFLSSIMQNAAQLNANNAQQPATQSQDNVTNTYNSNPQMQGQNQVQNQNQANLIQALTRNTNK